MVVRLIFVFLLASAGGLLGQENLNIVWPTPNPAYAAGRPAKDYVQPTVSGRVESAFFGCVRNSGARYHEGVDLKPISRDRRGEATDPIRSVMDGVVLYVNQVAGNSGYGRYIVIEHQDVRPPVMTLYAHLASVDDAIEAGARVRAGQTIGIMGRSAGGYTIPRERAHLHFELGFWITQDFQDWYDSRDYTTPNQHGALSGLNIIGMDPIDFFDRYRAGEVSGFQPYIEQLPVAFTLRVKSDRIPDFVRRYPSLVQGAIPFEGPAGWEIDFTSYGLPKRWRALRVPPDQAEQVRVIHHDPAIVAQHACRNALRIQRGVASIGSHTERTLQLLFGFR
jgi:peptidoglycan LD-endopeptidase LytH